MRTHHRIATSVQVDVPATDNPAVLAMIDRLDTGRMQATVLNLSGRTITDRLACEHMPAGAPVIDMFTDELIGEIDEDHRRTSRRNRPPSFVADVDCPPCRHAGRTAGEAARNLGTPIRAIFADALVGQELMRGLNVDAVTVYP